MNSHEKTMIIVEKFGMCAEKIAEITNKAQSTIYDKLKQRKYNKFGEQDYNKIREYCFEAIEEIKKN
ncbi:hypothetical protein [Chryseobacterium sp.]|uniref:hypothetical protein n=1 Tax=Chryseobacterium sp. TaxID=1871047 RepID=UPI00289F4BA7|nr:hypothetical protein [Chryseobacterium sp.]